MAQQLAESGSVPFIKTLEKEIIRISVADCGGDV